MSANEFYYHGKHTSKAIKESHENNLKSVEQIVDILRKAGKDFDVVTRRELSEKFVSKYTTVISAGGDGTVIATASRNLETLQLNLRTDKKSIGALCQKDIPLALEAFLAEDYKIENWTREDVYLNGKFMGRASNEVCIGEQLKFSKCAKYDLMFRDYKTDLKKKDHQSGSGLVVVTGTGSTAWPAAFKPFPKDSRYFRFQTMLIHSGTISRGKTEEVQIVYKGHEGKFAIDAPEYDFPRDSILEISISKYPLRVIIPNV